MKIAVFIGMIVGSLSALVGPSFLMIHSHSLKTSLVPILLVEFITGITGFAIYMQILKGRGQIPSLAIGGILILISFILFIVAIA